MPAVAALESFTTYIGGFLGRDLDFVHELASQPFDDPDGCGVFGGRRDHNGVVNGADKRCQGVAGVERVGIPPVGLGYPIPDVAGASKDVVRIPDLEIDVSHLGCAVDNNLEMVKRNKSPVIGGTGNKPVKMQVQAFPRDHRRGKGRV